MFTRMNLFLNVKRKEKATHHHQIKLLHCACAGIVQDSFLLDSRTSSPGRRLHPEKHSSRSESKKWRAAFGCWGCESCWGRAEGSTSAHGRRRTEKETGSCLGRMRNSSGVRAYELSVPLTDRLTRSSPHFKPCHLKTKTPTHFSSALP